ncbi:MAG: hypothetical protein Q4B54_09330 [Coriobacteriales bacterium]|nr:hypothetical protein [Coriobacteriales bacterium]
MQHEEQQTPNSKENEKVIESASATTSSDNANSGSFAYILTAIVLGVTLILGLVVGGCASMVLSVSAQQYAQGGHSSLGHNTMGYPEDLDRELEDLFNEYSPYTTTPEGGNGNNNGGSENTSVVSLDDALDFDLAPYRESIGDLVYASSYSGASNEVRDFVRQLVNADNDYASRLVLILNDAALNEEQNTQKIAEAIALCTEAQQGIEALALPEVGGDQSGEVKDYLGTAKAEAKERWQKMQNEMELLSKSAISTKALWNLDDDVLSATEKAAADLEQAMALSANR